MPTVEDYFDDDTDIPLPSSSRAHLPDTGLQGALVEEIGDDSLDFGILADQGRGEYGANSRAPPPQPVSENAKGKLAVRDGPGELRPTGGPSGPGAINPNTPMGGFMGDMMKLQEAEEERISKLRKQFGNTTIAQDPSVYKAWNTVYPLYFDAKVSINNGRRVPRKSALWWPQAAHIAKACSALGIPSVLEPEKTHPADWENPGRVKVQFEKDGRFLNPIIKNRTQLYTHLAAQMQHSNPSLVPQPVSESTTKPSSKPSLKVKAKGSKSKGPSAPTFNPVRLPTRPPRAPQPVPPADERLPIHSPIVATGVATSAVKRDLETEREAKKKGIVAPGEEGAKEKQPKLKRVVVRGKR